MFGTIVLRDVPKEQARIDLALVEIKGGFRGFAMVPPSCWHYVSVKDGAYHVGTWVRLDPNEVRVLVYDGDAGFVDDDPETVAQFTGLARSGAMGAALQPYPQQLFGAWFGMVGDLPRGGLPQLHAEEAGAGSRFERAFHGTHGGDAGSFLAEFEYAFASWLVSLNTPEADEAALVRWRHLLLACYNAGERGILAAGPLFPRLARVLQRQFGLLGDDYFVRDSWLVSQSGYMLEDMADAGGEELAQSARELRSYLAERVG